MANNFLPVTIELMVAERDEFIPEDVVPSFQIQKPEIALTLDEEVKLIVDFLTGKDVKIPPQVGMVNKNRRILNLLGGVDAKRPVILHSVTPTKANSAA